MEQHKVRDRDKWQAVASCDTQYDGLFVYAVKTTGIFCRPSCRAKTPLRGNVLFMESPGQALAAGFRPCKLCRPDTDRQGYNPRQDLAKKAKQMLDKRTWGIADLCRELGISPSYLLSMFREYWGVTPKAYVRKLRMEEAIWFLTNTDLDLLTIAGETGFNSQSAFYRCFKEYAGCPPGEFRRSRVE